MPDSCMISSAILFSWDTFDIILKIRSALCVTSTWKNILTYNATLLLTFAIASVSPSAGAVQQYVPPFPLQRHNRRKIFLQTFLLFFMRREDEGEWLSGRGEGGRESYPAWLREGLQQTRERTDTSWKILESCLASGDVALNLVLSSFPNRFSVHLDTASF